VDLLGKVLSTKPDDPVALFNRAIVSERIFLFTLAVEDWQHYLRIDAKGEWADEAKRRLAIIQEKLQKHDRSANKPLFSPSELLSLDSRSVPQTETIVNSRFEEYLQIATRDWLAIAFPPGRSTTLPAEAQTARMALKALARIAQEKHGDVWLADFLAQGTVSKIGPATEKLSKALKASDEGDFASAQSYAFEASVLFENERNPAGSLRARLEEVYALHLSEKGELCVRSAAALAPALTDRSYAWLSAQLDLEYAICEGMVGHLDQAQDLTQNALKIAEQSQYGVLYLRGLALASNNDSSTGNYRPAWRRDMEALARFWDGEYPSMRGYNVYTDLDTLADDFHQWYLQLAIWKQAIRVLPPHADALLVAMAHSRLANSALMSNERSLASEEFAETTRLFRLCPQTEATLNNEAEAEIALARLEVLQANLDSAFARLTRVQSSLPHISSRYVAINFYQTLSALHSARGDSQSAESSLRAGIALSERGLRSLRSHNDRMTWARETSSSYRSLVELLFRRGDTEGALEMWEWFRGASLRSMEGGGEPENDSAEWNNADFSTDAQSHSDRSLPRLTEVLQRSASLTKETVISYDVLPNGFAAWIYDDRGVESKWVAVDRTSLESRARRFNALCADPASDPGALRRDSRELYDLLIAPFSARLSPQRTLVIEPDGPISAIPFQALTDPQGTYLIERFAMAWSPGLYLAQAARPSETIQPTQSVLIVGANAPSIDGFQDLQQLPDVVAEARNIGAKFRNPRILLGSEATPQAIENALPQSAIFHFAGHAVSSTDDIRLVLAGGDSTTAGQAFLTASNFNAVSLHSTQLAVFSACTTEKTQEGNFTEPESLVMTFLDAGVPNVVATRWNVDSASTEAFMTRFYGFLVSGLTVAQALRAAGNAIRHDINRTHPYYWSAFNVFGRA
jgi:CHAT domain-containing protein